MNRTAPLPSVKDIRIAVIGMGYVGLPLAVEFGKKYPVVGYDVCAKRIDALQAGHDETLEVENDELMEASLLTLSTDPSNLSDCNFFIVTVPTPIDPSKRPDLTPLINATETIAKVLKCGGVVVYESTVYPGATEEDCVPILESGSGLRLNRDFYAGYSPERINPGDKQHRLSDIRKVTSGSTPEAADLIDNLYGSIISAGTYKAESIRVAEAAKVIENTQRDINIAFVNELAIIFNRIGVDTSSVLQAAETKWNFLPFRPGLVGGHCIGVDPYYLTHKAEATGYHPDIILAGRRLNDGMGVYVAGQMVKTMLKMDINVSKSRILIAGLTFKENCPDLRNSRVVDVIAELQEYGADVDVWDPWVKPSQAKEECGILTLNFPETGAYDGIILAVPHAVFVKSGVKKIREFGKPTMAFFDLKSAFPKSNSDLRL